MIGPTSRKLVATLAAAMLCGCSLPVIPDLNPKAGDDEEGDRETAEDLYERGKAAFDAGKERYAANFAAAYTEAVAGGDDIQWTATWTFDIPKAILVLNKSYEYLTSNHYEGDEGEGEE